MIGTIPLQATDIGCLTSSGDGWGCFTDSLVAAFFGEPTILGVIMGSLLILGLYIGSGYHPAPPSIGTMLIGGVMIPWLPVQYHAMAQTVMLMGFVTGLWLWYKNYVMEVGR